MNYVMKKIELCILTIGALVLLSGCAIYSSGTVELNVSDIREVVSDENISLMSPVTLEIDMSESEDDFSTQDECDELGKEMVDFLIEESAGDELLEPFFASFSPRVCKFGAPTVFLVDTEIPLVNGVEGWQNADTLLGVMTLVSERGIKVYLMYNLDDRDFLRECDPSSDEIVSTIKVNLKNENQLEEIIVQGVFLDGQAVNYGVYELERHSGIEIMLSNVGSVLLQCQGSVLAFELKI